MDDVLLYLSIVSVYINGIAHGLEGVKRDADGQRSIQNRQKSKACRLQSSSGKVPVFEEEQNAQIENHRGSHGEFCACVVSFFFAPVYDQTVGVVNSDGYQHDEGVDLLAPVIEKQGREQQNEIAKAHRHHIIDQQYQRQIVKQKQGCGKNHKKPPNGRP